MTDTIVEFRKIEAYDKDWPDKMSVSDFREWLAKQEQVILVKAPTAAEIQIEFGSCAGYEGCTETWVEFSFERPETEEEVKARTSQAAIQKQHRLAQLRAELQRLTEE